MHVNVFYDVSTTPSSSPCSLIRFAVSFLKVCCRLILSQRVFLRFTLLNVANVSKLGNVLFNVTCYATFADADALFVDQGFLVHQCL